MFSKFFINRPIFAAVVSIVITLGGAVALSGLPVAQYPELSPPSVTVSTSYPGADPQVVADTVAAPIEQQVNGVENMLYMSSTSAADGSYSLTITFETGTDLDVAAVLVQNRVSAALSSLPEEVTQAGVATRKRSPDFAMALNLISSDEKLDALYLSNYATLRIKDELSRIQGVGDVNVMGAGDYSMRLWLDPDKLMARGLTTDDVVSVIQEQNVQVAAGVIGQPPAPKGQTFQYTVSVPGRLQDVKQFQDIIIKTSESGAITRLGDVARVELGAEDYNSTSQLDGKPSSLIFVYQLPGANLLNLSGRVIQAMDRLSSGFPRGMEYVVTYDASWVVQASIQEIVTTLFIAAVLVILTVYVFLQDWRATLIPAVTIPVSLVGTFLVMSILGFSINTLTLFGLVLAIGIVVDDAIVVVENVSRNITESGLPPKQATERAMAEVTGPVVATTLVLLAVFIPTGFMGGITGVMYKQFALTIATATVFSSINALTLSPALCGVLLRRHSGRYGPFFRGFNRLLAKSTQAYLGVVGLAVSRRLVTLVVFAAIGGGMYWGMNATPTGFVPNEDQGMLLMNMQLPDGASLQRSRAVMEKVNAILTKTPGVANFMSITGFSILNGTVASNVGANVVVLKNWDERGKDPNQSLQGIMGYLYGQLDAIQEAQVIAFPSPALPGVGAVAGFDLRLQDRSGVGLTQLQTMANELVNDGNAQAGLQGLYTSFRANVPQLYVDVDRTKAKTMGVPLSTIFNTMQAYLGSAYVNDFNKFGRTYQVRIQADAAHRAHPDDIDNLQVRNQSDKMIPLSTLVKISETFGPQSINRYNLYPAASIIGQMAAGYSSGQAISLMEQMADQKLPTTMGYDWTGLAYQEVAAGSDTTLIFALAVVLVYLVLAAQYESWKIPAPVILAVPLALAGAFAATLLRGLDNNLYTQIGLVLLVGLAAKNAILIVEFAKEKWEGGMQPGEAALEASRLRFRPILMTAFSFILGVLPLVLADGAGAGARQALGTAVFGGMLAATILGVVFVPLLFSMFQSRHKDGKPKRD
jgi:HAE1 family hydrophobic/amphiphilic exporter-1